MIVREDSMTTVAILCGGQGTRLYPFTKTNPKALVPVGGRPLLDYTLEHCKKQGFTDIVLCEGNLADRLQEYVGDGSRYGLNIKHVVESTPLGTAGALKNARQYLSNPTIVFQGDLYITTDMRKLVDAHKTAITMLVNNTHHPSGCDLVELDGRVVTRRYFPNFGEEFSAPGSAGIYVIDPAILDSLPEGNTNLEDDLVANYIPKRQVLAYSTEEYVKDVGTPERLKEAENYLLSQKLTR